VHQVHRVSLDSLDLRDLLVKGVNPVQLELPDQADHPDLLGKQGSRGQWDQ